MQATLANVHQAEFNDDDLIPYTWDEKNISLFFNKIYTLFEMGWQKTLLTNRRNQEDLAPIIVVKLTKEMCRHSLNKHLKPTFNSH